LTNKNCGFVFYSLALVAEIFEMSQS